MISTASHCAHGNPMYDCSVCRTAEEIRALRAKLQEAEAERDELELLCREGNRLEVIDRLQAEVARLKERCEPNHVVVINGVGHYVSTTIKDRIAELEEREWGLSEKADSRLNRIAELEAAGTQTALNLIAKQESNNQELITYNMVLEQRIAKLEKLKDYSGHLSYCRIHLVRCRHEMTDKDFKCSCGFAELLGDDASA